MSRKISIVNGQFIKQTNKKRPGRHSKKRNAKKPHKKEYVGQGRG